MYIRAAVLPYCAEVARSLGLDAALMMRDAGLEPETLQNPELKIPFECLSQLLEGCAAAAGVDDFGLRVSERKDGLADTGILAMLAREQPTIGAAAETFSRYLHLHDEVTHFRIERAHGVATITMEFRLNRPVATRQAMQLAVGITYRILCFLLGAGPFDVDAHFMFPQPSSREVFRRLFLGKVFFGAQFNGITFPASYLDRPVPGASAAMARVVQRYVDKIADRPLAIDDKVRELVVMMLPTGRCSIDTVSEYLGYHRRTVHRLLAERGLTYTEIVDAQRTALVFSLIEDRSRPLGAVAKLLGFATQAALARWFHDRFGSSISQWRKEQRRKPAGAAGSSEQS